MSTATDTLRTAETLQEAGVPERQATAHARSLENGCAAAVADLGDQLTWRIVLVVGGFTVGTASLVVAVLFRLLG